MSNKTYTTNKTTNQFECVRCNFICKTKSEMCKHVFDEKKKQKRLTPFDLHRTKQCGKNSRICRYCHPEDDIKQKDVNESMKHFCNESNRFDTSIIIKLLSCEYRYRHKFNQKHFDQLIKSNKRKNSLFKMISNRIEKRIKTFDATKDGKQTPYMAHGIDVAMHSLGVCCRWCLNRWYKINYSEILTENIINQISKLTYDYINDYILNGSKSMKQFMTEIKKNQQVDMFYKPGNYLFYKMDGIYEVILEQKISEKNMNNNNNSSLQCAYCQKKFDDNLLFNNHLKQHEIIFESNNKNKNTDNLEREICIYCDKSFLKGNQYQTHIEKEKKKFKRKANTDNKKRQKCESDDDLVILPNPKRRKF